jgi:hypothetical protein
LLETTNHYDWTSILGNEIWAHLIILDPVLRSRLERRGFIRQAIETGKQVAGKVHERFPGKSAEDILDDLGVRVILTQDNPNWGARLQCAEYQQRPPQVTIYERAMEELARMADSCQLNLFADPIIMRDVSLSHELYHHLERTEYSPVSKQLRLVWKQIGPFTFYTRVAQLDEIAAHAFAQELCGLSNSPGILDLLGRYTSTSGRAKLFRQAQEIHIF